MNRRLLAFVFAVAGCVPALEDQCEVDGDCDTGERCLAKVCVKAGGPGELDQGRGEAGGGGRVNPDGEIPLDMEDADGPVQADEGDLARPDGPVPDAAVDGAAPPDVAFDGPPLADAGPDGDAAPCVPDENGERCNGLDDDCDHVADEGTGGLPLVEACYEGEPGTGRVGVCRVGQAACDEGILGACVGQVRPSAEMCDGLDNDCDSAIDEGVEAPCYQGPAGTVNVGVCRPGVRRCTAGLLGACTDEVVPRVEICDNADNDCNGRVDEVEGGCGECVPGAACYSGDGGTAGVGACRAGRQTCREGGGFDACTDEVVPTGESCDDVDNDCDGRTDESLPLDQPCVVGQGACTDEGVTVCRRGDEGWAIECDAVAGAPVVEVCDEADNDCDGRTDEGLELGDACTSGVGPCRRDGVRVCLPGGRAGCSAQPGEPSTEACNGVDDDCDGTTDEGEISVPCYSGPGGTAGVGRCRSGARACGDEACVGEVLPTGEVCNGLDDDCNGEPDDRPGQGCECEPGQQVPCYEADGDTVDVGVCAEGARTCRADHTYSACVGATYPGQETCDDEDDDCDGRVDEGTPGAGAGCQDGRGECRRDGLLVCDGAAGELVCDVEPGEATDEVCDGLDNDCDGWLDEDLPRVGEDCARGLGACAAEGTRRCVPARGAVVCDAEPGAPSDEVCNGEDDDCDGATDEGTLNACGRCGALPAEICNRRDEDCDGRVDEGVRNACDACGAVPAEVCNRRDDDCDGATDEGVANACGDCGAVPVEACNGSDDDCDGRVDEGVSNACGGCGAAPPEACNGEDDDCDGAIDEDVLNACGACGPVPVEVCNEGDDDCDGDVDEDVTNACGQCGEVPGEVCNGRDDDCDGAIDEGVRNACGHCGVVPVEQCNGEDDDCDDAVDEGLLNACGECGELAVEVCNGEDDDCDDAVDEGLDGVPCDTGRPGACAEGVAVCEGEGLECQRVGEPTDEVCDDVDNDCDAEVDEGEEKALCGAPHAVGRCVGGECRDYACDARWFDIDDDLENGCERGCGPAQSPDAGGDGADHFALHVDADGTHGVASVSRGTLQLRIGQRQYELGAPGVVGEVDLIELEGWWVVAARVTVEARPVALQRIVLFHVMGDRVLEQVLLRDGAGPPTLNIDATATRTPMVTVVYVAEEAVNRRRAYAYRSRPGAVAEAELAFPDRISEDGDWRLARLGAFETPSGATGIIGGAHADGGDLVRYRRIGGGELVAERVTASMQVTTGISAARYGAGVVYAIGHAAGLRTGALTLGAAPSFGAQSNTEGRFSRPSVSTTALGALAYFGGVAREADGQRASVLLVGPDGSLVGGPLDLDDRQADAADGQGASCAWNVGDNGLALGDTGCN